MATKADRVLLNGFTCTADNGPPHEHLVQRYFRAQAIRQMGGLDGIRADHRLLLLFLDDELVAAGCHQRSHEQDRRNFVFAAVATSHQGVLVDDRRISDGLWEVVSNDMLDRANVAELIVVAKVDPANSRSLRYCERIGLRPRGPDNCGLIICAGMIGR